MTLSNFTTPRRLTQLAVWVLVALCAAFTLVPASQQYATPPSSAPAWAAPQNDPLGTGTAGGSAVDEDEKAREFVAGIPSAYTPDELADQIEEAENGDEYVNELLPAYRWSGSMQFQSDPADGFTSGLSTFDDKLVSAIASLEFAVAGAMWRVLLGMTAWAFTTDAVDSLGTEIDTMVVELTDDLTGAGLVAIVIVMLLLGVVASFTGLGKGRTKDSVRNVVVGVLVLGAMQLSASFAGTGNDLSPTGLAMKGSEVINTATTQITTPLTSSPRNAPEEGAKKEGSTPNCEWYIARLYSTYFAANQAEAKGQDAALILMSRLWESTMLRAFTEAQYGVYEEGRYAACHQLEHQARISREVQATIAGGEGSPYSKMAGVGDPTSDENVFTDSFGQAKHRIAYYFAWMACRNGDATAWPNVNDDQDGDDRLTNDDCTTWWEEGFDTEKDIYTKNDDDDSLVFTDIDSISEKTNGSDNVEYEVVSTFYGGGSRFFVGMVSIAVASLYFYALGALAIGTIASTFLLAFCLMLSPFMFLLLALPAKGGSRNKAGVRMLRLTGASLMAKATFYLSITLMCLIINILNSVVL